MKPCYYKFKSPECGYVGLAIFCTKTFECCRKLNNIQRWPVSPESFIVNGPPMTRETIIVTALVKRLGGNVFLPEEELSLLSGLVIKDKDGGLNLNV